MRAYLLVKSVISCTAMRPYATKIGVKNKNKHNKPNGIQDMYADAPLMLCYPMNGSFTHITNITLMRTLIVHIDPFGIVKPVFTFLENRFKERWNWKNRDFDHHCVYYGKMLLNWCTNEVTPRWIWIKSIFIEI